MSLVTSSQAIQILKEGKLVAIPTETVYGLAADINQTKALEKIFQTKNRPLFDPLIIHVSSKKMAKRLATDWNQALDLLADFFWPGPLTLVVEKAKDINPLITAGANTVGLRCPNHPLTLDLIEKLQLPLAAPSANYFGKTSPTSAQHVLSEFNELIPVLDGGACKVGLESTVLGVQKKGTSYQLTLYRLGMISLTEISHLLLKNQINYQVNNEKALNHSPGQLKDHYQPNKPVIFCRSGTDKNKIDERFKNAAKIDLNDDVILAARELYHQLRILSEQKNIDCLYYQQKEQEDEKWQVIEERLLKASTYLLTQKGLTQK